MKIYSSEGSFIKNIGDGLWNQPTGIAFNASGDVYVADNGDDCVRVFDSTGNFRFSWNFSDLGYPDLYGLKDIAINATGYVYVVDQGLQTVHIFAPNGEYITQLGDILTGFFLNVCGIDINATGNAWITDYREPGNLSDDIIKIFNPSGNFLKSIDMPDGVKGGIAIDSQGYVLVSEQSNTLRIISLTGETIGKVSYSFYDINRIAINPISNQLYVVDGVTADSVIYVFNPSPGDPGPIPWTEIIIGIVATCVALFLGWFFIQRRHHRAVQVVVQKKEIRYPIQVLRQWWQRRAEHVVAQDAAEQYPVQVLRQFEYVAGKVRIKMKVINTSSTEFHQIRMSLEIPPSFRLLRVDPANYIRVGYVVHIGNLLAYEEKALAWLLEPLICGKELIRGTVSGKKPKGKFKIPLDPLMVEVRCPMFVQPEEANLPTVQRMLENLPVHSVRSFLLPNTLNPEDAFEIAKRAIAQRDVLFVGTIGSEKGEPYLCSAWFYGVTKAMQKRFVISASVSEADHAIQITSACDEEDSCTGFLAEAGASVRRELVLQGAVDSEDGVVELLCEKCGATLPHAPYVGRDVICPDCHWLWRVSDFYQ